MKVLLIVPAIGFTRSNRPTPLGNLSIATNLKENGHEIKIYDRSVKKNKINRQLKDFKPDIVGISTNSFLAVEDSIKISCIIKKNNIPVVWGGPMASSVPELVLNTKFVDFVVIGEGELTFLELIKTIEEKKSFHDIDGLAFFENEKVIINKQREFADLSRLPVIDWTFLDISKYLQSYFYCKKMIRVYSSKGCPHECTFCSNTEFHRRTYRRRPFEYVLSEIEYLIAKYGVDGVFFTDECWCQTSAQMSRICNLIKERNLNFVWGCQTRTDQFAEKDFRLMYDAGCRWVFFGVESGSNETLKRVKKKVDINLIKETLSNCKNAGITTIGSFIIGFPGETEKELKETIRFALDSKIDVYNFNHYTTLPGSEIYNYLTSNGLYTEPKALMEWSKKKVGEKIYQNFTEVPTRELLVIVSFFNWLSLSQKDSSGQSKSSSFARMTINNIIENILRYNIFLFIARMFLAAKDFISIVWNVIAHPKIRKKYGLYDENK